MAKFIYKNTRQSVAKYQPQTNFKMLLIIKAIWPKKISWRSKKSSYFENKHNSPSRKKRMGTSIGV